jgi:hypothetical protein
MLENGMQLLRQSREVVEGCFADCSLESVKKDFEREASKNLKRYFWISLWVHSVKTL